MTDSEKQTTSELVFTILCKQQDVRDALLDLGFDNLATDADAILFAIRNIFDIFGGCERLKQLKKDNQ